MNLSNTDNRIVKALRNDRGHDQDRDMLIKLSVLDETTFKLRLSIVQNGQEFSPNSTRTLLLVIEGDHMGITETFEGKHDR